VQGFARPGAWGALRAYRDWCIRNRLALVHTWEIYSNVFGLAGAALARVPVRIGSRRGLNPDRRPSLRWLQRLSYTAAHRIVANSRAAARQLEREGVPDSRVSVVYNGLDLDRFPDRLPCRKTHRVLAVAGIRHVKGIDVLVEAAARVVAAVPDVRFVVAGDGPDRSKAEAQARALGVDRAFEFLGHRDDVPALMAEADVFVLPSRSEAFPNALLEAMAAGLPVVASRVGGVVELVEHGHTGLIVAPDDPDALAGSLIQLLRESARAAAIGAAARESVRARYSVDRMVQQFEALYIAELELRAPHAIAGAVPAGASGPPGAALGSLNR
jgi:glycosyltransferase involved in cell wall biosynthesis